MMPWLLLAASEAMQRGMRGALIGSIVGGGSVLLLSVVLWIIKKASGTTNSELHRARSRQRHAAAPGRKGAARPITRSSSPGLVVGLILGGVALVAVFIVIIAIVATADSTPVAPHGPHAPAGQVPPVKKPLPPIDKAILDLTSGNIFEQSESARMLADMRPDDKRRAEVNKALVAAVGKPAGQAPRGEAVEALGTWATAAEGPFLTTLLDDADGHVRQMAIRALGCVREVRAAPTLAQRLENGFEWAVASQALKDIGPGAEPALLNVIRESKNDHARVVACQILKAVGTKASQPLLEASLQDPSYNLVLAAREALDALAQRTSERKTSAPAPKAPRAVNAAAGPIDEAIALLASRDGSKQQEAAKRLASIKMDEARRADVRQALRAAADKRAGGSPRADIVQALGVWATVDEVHYLTDLLDDPDGGVRQMAMRALGTLKDARPAIFLARRLENAFEWNLAVESLKQIGPAAEPSLHQVYAQTKNDHVRVQACHVLKSIGTPASQSLLEAALKSSNPNIAGAAREALEAISLRAKEKRPS